MALSHKEHQYYCESARQLALKSLRDGADMFSVHAAILVPRKGHILKGCQPCILGT